MKTLAVQENILKIYPELQAYLPHAQNAQELAKRATELQALHNDGHDVAKEAKVVRLAIKKARLALDKERKELKSEALEYSKAIDGTAKPIKDFCSEVEEEMQAIEKAAEIAEQKRVLAVEADRLDRLEVAGCPNPHIFRGLGTMDEEAFEALLEGETMKAKHAKEEAKRIAKVQAEAEAKRQQELADAKAEALAKQTELDAERERNRKAEEARQATLEKARQLNESRMDELRRLGAVADFMSSDNREPSAISGAEWASLLNFYTEEAERKAKAKAEEDARIAKLEAEAKALRDKEQAEAERLRLLEQGSDKQKLIALLEEFKAIQSPNTTSEFGGKVVAGVDSMKAKMLSWLDAQIQKM